MGYNARKAYNDVVKSGINSARDKDRYIMLQEILTKIEGRAKMGERSIVIEEPVNSWDFILPVVEKLRELGFTVDPKFLQSRGWVLAIYWNRKPKSGAENLIIAALALLVLSDGFNILISDREVLIHLIQKP